jgi:hypothetical protein
VVLLGDRGGEEGGLLLRLSAVWWRVCALVLLCRDSKDVFVDRNEGVRSTYNHLLRASPL